MGPGIERAISIPLSIATVADRLAARRVGWRRRFIARQPIIRQADRYLPRRRLGHRELALHLANHGRPTDALPHLEIAKKLEPESSSYFYTLGHALNRDDHPREAGTPTRKRSASRWDNEVAIVELFALARSDEEQPDAIEFVADELRRTAAYTATAC